jgi:hypothetical protein
VRAYGFHGLVGREATLRHASAAHPAALARKLRDGLASCELSDELAAALGGGGASPYIEFVRLTPGAAAWAAEASRAGIVAYLEAEFADGAGFHAAVVWRDGKIVYGPTSSEDREAVNAALRLLGAGAAGASDELASVGLLDR